MKNSIEERLQHELNKEQELPQSVRIAFDQSYEQIRQQSKKKTKNSWLKPVTAAVATIALATAVMFSNDKVLAKLQSFFGLNDPGIEIASDHGDVQYVAQSQQSEDVTITLEHFFADAYRLAMQLNIESDHIQMEDLYDMNIEYRLYNEQGEVIDAFVSDTKPKVGPGIFSSGEFKLSNVNKHAATLEMLIESSTKAVPSLDGAKIVIETVNFSTKQEGIISVDGEWAFDLKPATVESQVFVAENEVAGLELQQATLTNGSLHISLKISQNIEDENYIMDTKLLTDNKEAFYANAANVERTNDYTIINLVFPYSIWKKQKTLLLSVNGYEKLKLVEKE
ncbi:DUF4179 domain-containing protein [Lysinibacillus sp. NPDC097162]|uniref:DUF4179 domain-containing protein n=1 Tax=Lysinibacillus sp. NPDC097162 TaxID=3364140 RepID=UPI00381501E3